MNCLPVFVVEPELRHSASAPANEALLTASSNSLNAFMSGPCAAGRDLTSLFSIWEQSEYGKQHNTLHNISYSGIMLEEEKTGHMHALLAETLWISWLSNPIGSPKFPIWFSLMPPKVGLEVLINSVSNLMSIGENKGIKSRPTTWESYGRLDNAGYQQNW